MSKLKVHHIYLLMMGAILQFIGVGLSSALPTTTDKMAARQYGYEAVMGVGFGLQMSTLMIPAPLIVKEADLGLFGSNASHEAWMLTCFASRHDGRHYADSRSWRELLDSQFGNFASYLSLSARPSLRQDCVANGDSVQPS